MSIRESILAKLESLENFEFTLPTLKETITYRKLDIIEGSVNGSMPNFIASKILDKMKQSLNGEQDTETDNKIESTDQDVKDLLIKATETWEKAVIDPKLEMSDIVRIPSEDRIAWFMDAITQSYSSKTTSGSEVSLGEVATFPSKGTSRRNSKRAVNS